ncbi:hypothetical protein N431DRAFT_425663 [Stipitochalara longipes BDJ]|nr:hypothetical protein N431DRAFT_425663 [Stipitochalara longipes BDJ]
MTHDILLTTASGIVRIVLRIYFTVLLLLVAILGNSFCALRARWQLAHYGRIPVVKLTGWLNWSQALLLTWSLRSNALGFFGIVMVFTSLLSKASDLVVLGLVNEVMIETRCPFNTSTDFLVLANEYYGVAHSAPDPEGSFYNLVTQAQINSVRNGGLDAIYGKVNTNINFRANPEDVVANWTCSELGDPSTSPVYDSYTTYQNITTDLANRNLIFADVDNAYISCFRTNGLDPRINQLVIITANNTQETDGTFSIRASFDTTPSYTDAKAMRSFECNLGPQNQTWMQTHIGVQSTLTSWCSLLRGDMYDGYSTNKTFTLVPETRFESYLHSMIMSANSLMSPTTSMIHDYTQGCMDGRTIVPWPVTLLLAAVTVFFIAMVCAWLALVVMVHSRPGARALSAGDNGTVPLGMLGWIRYAVRQSPAAAQANEADGMGSEDDIVLRKWCVERTSSGGRLRVRIRQAGEGLAQREGWDVEEEEGVYELPRAGLYRRV